MEETSKCSNITGCLTHDHLFISTRVQLENQVCQECLELMDLPYVILFIFVLAFVSLQQKINSPQLPVFCKAWTLHPLFSGSPRKGGTYWHQRKSGGCQTSTLLPRIYLKPGQAHLKGLNCMFHLLVLIYLKFCCELVLLSLTLSRVPTVPRDLLAILVLVVSRLVQEQSLNIKYSSAERCFCLYSWECCRKQNL